MLLIQNCQRGGIPRQSCRPVNILRASKPNGVVYAANNLQFNANCAAHVGQPGQRMDAPFSLPPTGHLYFGMAEIADEDAAMVDTTNRDDFLKRVEAEAEAEELMQPHRSLPSKGLLQLKMEPLDLSRTIYLVGFRWSFNSSRFGEKYLKAAHFLTFEASSCAGSTDLCGLPLNKSCFTADRHSPPKNS
eukprot:Gb_23672 [translate_table: standard]